MFRGRAEAMLFRPGTVPVPVLVTSLLVLVKSCAANGLTCYEKFLKIMAKLAISSVGSSAL